ncbi:MAG TPA: lysylphosphatidylglycerol synthase transmembrane domain-containing protein [Longimicrobium sp.]|nr:lysylphosphatidylglycerol synthase transmembrane domain-containing protein [Longimicrobium sp.]
MKPHLKAVVGIAATAVFLWLALRGVDWAEVVAHLRDADPLLLAAAVLVSTVGMHIRALRWKPLLAPVAPGVAWRPRIAAVCIGFGANNVFPARLGEFARAWVLSRQAAVPLPAAFASLALERVLDGIVCISFLLGAMAMPAFPPLPTGGAVDPGAAARLIGLLTAVLALSLLALAFFPSRFVAVAERVAGWTLPKAFRRPLVDALHAFAAGLHVLKSPRLLALSVAWALFQWSFLAVSFWLAFRAFGITAPGYLGAVFLQSLIALAVAIPSAPGFFGPFEAAARWGLGLWGSTGRGRSPSPSASTWAGG